ncbi:MAG: 50S ribosomal protein L11 methyltransferase [Flavobacteriales bacterium]|nr:50S ribosomal protein L11 methyltransferase [Flavobacteriales bacterium]
MNYFEVNIVINPVHPWRDLINSDLGELNYETFVETEQGVQAFIRVEDYSKDNLKSLLGDYEDDCESSFSVKKIESINWNEEWEKNFSPIVVNEKCIVRATFHNLDKEYPYDIVINPKMSFGTGHHATTT